MQLILNGSVPIYRSFEDRQMIKSVNNLVKY